jgi:hypothetical protein
LPIPQGWLERVAAGLDEVEDASREFNLKVQIVSRPPDQSFDCGPVSAAIVYSD